MIEKPCKFCQRPFFTKRNSTILCSNKCRSDSQRKRIAKTCEWCSKVFEAKQCHVKNGVYKFCNTKCKGMARRGKSYYTQTQCDRLASSKRLKKLWQTKTFRDKMGIGRHQNAKGYWLIKSPYHPFKNKAGFVYEHRLVAEGVIGRFLTAEECIHHINEARHDNGPENLYLFSDSAAHTTYHADVRRGITVPIVESNLADYRVTK